MTTTQVYQGSQVAAAGSAAGSKIAGRYRLIKLIGRGGMGRVWLADDELLDREVALKQILLGDLMSEDADSLRESALAEARAAAKLNHPGAVQVHDLVIDGGEPWIVMELLTGENLSQAGPLPAGEVVRIARQLLDVLEAVHAAGLVHRDVKPANVHLAGDGRVVLTDFGIAAATDDESTVPAGGMAGSPAYISPERARGDAVGPESDLFSLGATLFAAVEGRSPFGKGDPFSTLVAVVQDEPGPFVNAGPLRPVIEGLLAKKPSERLTAAQARDLLP